MTEEQQYLTVSALTKYIKRKFDADPHLQTVYVRGEISNFKLHTSGHMYFTLKDSKSRILAVMFAMNAKGMKFVPENGMKVLIQGDVSVYEASGQYQIYVKHMSPDGIGDLYLAYEQLKQKLAENGMFSDAHKKALPSFPKVVGVITSPTGAVLRDIRTTIARRFPIAKIIIYPALVQGEQAPKSISMAIATANSRKEADVLIVGRGGGSIEELWAFNEEMVAQSIYDSDIPIISAVGHETDYTIADFVADLRAPTPTAAAELAVPHIHELMGRISDRKARLNRAIQERLQFEKSRITRLEKSYAFRYPQKTYEQKVEQLDKAIERLKKNSYRLFLKKEESFVLLQKALLKNHPEAIMQMSKQGLDQQQKALKRAMELIMKDKFQSFMHLNTKLDAVSPLKIMDKGYGLIFSEEKLIKSRKQVEIGDSISVAIKDGTLECEIREIKERIET